MAKQYRLLRIIEYVGDADFIQQSVDRRAVKGRHFVRKGCFIQESIIGETGELLEDAVPPAADSSTDAGPESDEPV